MEITVTPASSVAYKIQISFFLGKYKQDNRIQSCWNLDSIVLYVVHVRA